jgi:glycosyltransferase involved in cell wall biosynthesis
MSPDIAIFLPDLGGGGTERVVVNLANLLSTVGCDVEVVVSQANGPLRRGLVDGVEIVDLNVRKRYHVVRSLARYLMLRRPAAVLSHMDIANVAAILAKEFARSKVPLVVCSHITPSIHARESGRLQDLLLVGAIRWLYPRADGIVAVSNGVADDLNRNYGIPRERITVIHNPVVTEELVARSREPLDHPWFAVDDPPVLLAVGRLTRQKDYPTLLRAFKHLRGERRARLVILGEGEEREALERSIRELGIAEDVQLLGFVENPYSYMRQARLLVLSSAWEGFGNVLVEAMACGTPVVSTDCPSGPREILENGRYGTLVPVGDPIGLVAGINSSLDQSVSVSAATDRAMEFSADTALEMYRSIMDFGR